MICTDPGLYDLAGYPESSSQTSNDGWICGKKEEMSPVLLPFSGQSWLCSLLVELEILNGIPGIELGSTT